VKVCFGVSPCVEGLFRGAVIYFRLVEDFVWTVWDAVWGQGVIVVVVLLNYDL
jgi:hypothetical protein